MRVTIDRLPRWEDQPPIVLVESTESSVLIVEFPGGQRIYVGPPILNDTARVQVLHCDGPSALEAMRFEVQVDRSELDRLIPEEHVGEVPESRLTR
jgi:hypothetical protein